MYWNKLFFLCLILCFGHSLWGQHQKVLHKSFQLDSLKELSIDLIDQYEVEPWAGDAVLVETTIKLYDASSGILTFLIENERYNIDADTIAETGLHLFSVKKERKPVRTSKGECFEEVKVRVFLPDTFEQQEEHKWVDPKAEEEAASAPLPAKALPADSLQKKNE